MKYLICTVALFLGTYGFSQTEGKATSKVITKEAVKTGEKKPAEKKKMKTTKIDRPIIDKYTKPREVSEPKKENK